MKEFIEKSNSVDLEKEFSVLKEDAILEAGKTQFKLDTVEISNSSGTTLTYNPKISNPNKIKKDASTHIEPPVHYDANGAVIDPDLERYDMTFKNVVQIDGRGSFNLSPIGKYKNCKHIKTGDADRSNLGQLCKESGPVLTIMDHNSPDKMFGYPRKEFARMLAESGSKYIILGTCNGQNLAEEVLSICYKNKITDKIIYSPTYDNKRHGIHPGEASGSIEYIFGDQFVRSSLGKNSAQDPADAPDYIINDYSDRPRSLVNPVDTYSKRSST